MHLLKTGENPMYWYLTEPRSDDDYGQPDSDGVETAAGGSNMLWFPFIFFLVLFVAPLLPLLLLLWQVLAAICSGIATKIDSTLVTRR